MTYEYDILMELIRKTQSNFRVVRNITVAPIEREE